MAVGESAGTVYIVIDGDASPLMAKYAQAETASRAAGQRVASDFNSGTSSAGDGAERFGQRTTHAFEQISSSSRKAVTDIQAVSGTLRTLDGNQGIRAAERFLTMIPGLAPALQSIFPIIGAIAFAEVVARAAEHFQKLGLGGSDAGQKIDTAFRDVNQEIRASNDSLQVGNDRLENEIAKIEHKPENGIKLALDEAIQAADELGKSRDTDLSKLSKTVGENKVGILGQILGKASTSDIEAQLTAFQDKVAKITAQSAIPRQESVGGVSILSPELLEKQKIAAQTKTNIELNQIYTDELQKLGHELKTAMIAPGDGAVDSSQKIEILRQSIANLTEQQKSIGLRATGANLKDQKDDAQAKAEAERTANEEHKKQVEALAKSDEDALEIDARTYKANTAELIAYWESRLSAESGFAERDEAINRKLTQLHTENQAAIERVAAHGAEVMKQQTEKAEQFARKMGDIADEAEENYKKVITDPAEKQKEIDIRVSEIQTKGQGDVAVLQIQRQKIDLERQYGLQISHSGAEQVAQARQLAALDSQERAQKLAIAEGQLKEAEAASVSARDQTKIATLTAEIATLKQQNANADAQSASQIDQQNQKLVQQLSLEQQINNAKNAAQSTLQRNNQSIGTNIGNAVGSLPQSIGNDIGGSISNALLGHHPGKSIGQEMGEQLVSTLKSTAAGLLKSLLSGGIQLGLGALGFASGTDSAPGGMSLVGEKGPEIVNLPRGSQVIPNHAIHKYADGTPGYRSSTHYQSTSFQTGTTNLHFHAHGISDPNRFTDHVMRTIPEALKRTSPGYSPYSH